ncbi:MAG: tetratricopeptide repeat protein [Acidobacteriota bacterium]
MDKKSIFVILASLFFMGSFSSTSCSRMQTQTQIGFGITAAENELWDEAIFRWKKALLENPSSAAAHNNLAVAYEKRGLWEEAKKEYELALQLDPNNDYIQSNYKNFKQIYVSEESNEKTEDKKKS